MDRLRLCLWFLAGLIVSVVPVAVHAETTATVAVPIDIASAVDISGRQRMLSQRMMKAYLMLGQNIAAEDARSELQDSINQFESQLVAQKAFQPTAKVKNSVARLDVAWLRCKTLLAAVPGKEGAADLHGASETLQKAAHDVTLAYESISGEPLVHLVNLVGRQRMLSQRMAKFYFYRTWDLFGDPSDMELHLSQAHFTAVLNQIENSPYATVQIKEGLVKLRQEWKPYQQFLFASKDPVQMRENALRVAELSERTLMRAEELVALIVAQAQAVS